MLNYNEFQYQLERLKEVFGDSRFPDPRSARIWEIVKELSPVEWTGLVNRMIDYSRSPPTPGDFRDDVREIKKSRIQTARYEDLIACDMCAGKGGHYTDTPREFKIMNITVKVPVWVPCLECQKEQNEIVKCVKCNDTNFVFIGKPEENLTAMCPACHPRAGKGFKPQEPQRPKNSWQKY